jgi:acetyl-CoA carboxylase biotin carboxyl carrier protein
VGTFYSSASPDAEPFVKVGDHVSKGQVLGIIEAMKLMNDIESDYDGEVVEILVNNKDMVEFGQPLFIIK